MTKVYIAWEGWKYEGIVKIIGAYISKKLAEEAMESYKEENKIESDCMFHFYEIEEFELEKGETND